MPRVPRGVIADQHLEATFLAALEQGGFHTKGNIPIALCGLIGMQESFCSRRFKDSMVKGEGASAGLRMSGRMAT
jgi:hypothetical protein